jgi:transposase
VSQRTISSDLKGLEATSKPLRPKGGRPKAEKPEKKTRAEVAPKAVEREQLVEQLMARGKSSQEIAAELGVGLRATNQAMEHVKIRQEAEAQIDPASLSLSAQQKLEAAIRQHKRKLDAELAEQRAQLVTEFDRIKIDWLRTFNERQAEYDAVILARKGVMTRKTFDAIRRCLHPDSRQSVSDERLAEAFRLFGKLELKLLPESDFPTRRFKPLNPADLLEAKVRADQARRAKANGPKDVARRN